MPILPSGTTTFLFADIEGSSRLWEDFPETMRLAVARHERLATEIIHAHGGSLVKHRGEGDSLFAVFVDGVEAIGAALALQTAYRVEPWPTPVPVRTRMALHSGEAELRDDDYFGNTVNRCARLRAHALNGLGVLASQQNDYVTAEVVLHESLALYNSLEDRGGIAESLNCQGRLALALSHYAEARRLFEQSLTFYRSLGDLWGVGANLNNLGIVARTQGDHVAVIAFYEESLTLYRTLGDLSKVASVASNLGIIALDRKDYVKARTLFEESLITFRQLNDAVGIATTLHNLGAAVLKLEGHTRAFPLFRDSLLRKLEIGNRASIALTLFGVAEVARDAADFEHAARLFSCAEAAWISAGMVLSAEDQRDFNEAVEPVRVSLSADQFQHAWIAGRNTPLDKAADTAIQARLTNRESLC